MSHPNTTTNHHKRPACTTTGGGGDHCNSPMKKAKSQAIATTTKNGLHFDTDVEISDEPSSVIEDLNPNDLLDSPSIGAAAGRASSGGVTSNLSRKKATLPQPAKKLVIKLVKGSSSVFFSSMRVKFRFNLMSRCVILLIASIQ